MPDYRSPAYQPPIQKPVAKSNAGLQFSSQVSSSSPTPPTPVAPGPQMNQYPQYMTNPYFHAAPPPPPPAPHPTAATAAPHPPRQPPLYHHHTQPLPAGATPPILSQPTPGQRMHHGRPLPHKRSSYFQLPQQHPPGIHHHQQQQQQHAATMSSAPAPSIAGHHPSPATIASSTVGMAPARRVSSATSNSSRSGTMTTATTMGRPSYPSYPPTQTNLVRRSSSTASSNPQTGYVAIMRRQKATAWSERTQMEDPRVVAARRVAKMKAAQAVYNGGRNMASTAGGKSKHANGGSMTYGPGTMIGAAVPTRLLANELDGDDQADLMQQQQQHRRNGSGVSSGGSVNRQGSAANSQRTTGQHSSKPGTPVTATESPKDIPSIVEPGVTPTSKSNSLNSAHGQQAPAAANADANANAHPERPGTAASDGSATEEDFGKLTEMVGPVSMQKLTSVTDELKRRGSVDERSSNMTG
ncbi:hypothetical protein KEM55_002873, partial [Ascosphaera atra]